MDLSASPLSENNIIDGAGVNAVKENARFAGMTNIDTRNDAKKIIHALLILRVRNGIKIIIMFQATLQKKYALFECTSCTAFETAREISMTTMENIATIMTMGLILAVT